MTIRSITLLAAAAVAAGYQWPNPRMEAFDFLRWDQAGVHGVVLGQGVVPCNQYVVTPAGNQTNAAQWLRTAYHDVSTHDANAGTGGMDGSIRFELDRAENAGSGFGNTLPFTQLATNRYVSYADSIAAAALFAVEGCGGPHIDFRGGRVDATEAGPPGVPQSQDSLKSHTAAFARIGFSPKEMIQLVACGHTIGGVQRAAFPDIVPEKVVSEKYNPDGNVVFDQTFAAFDNHIAVEYVSGRSVDPLVVGPNVTMRSDARIFASDGNVTMKALAKSPSLFASTCGTLLSRMLNTVPRSVKLTEVIEPLPVKPTDYSLVVHPDNNTFTFNANVRFWNLPAGSDATVRILWADNSGKPCTGCAAPLQPYVDEAVPEDKNVGISLVGNHTSLWFQIQQPGISIGAGGISRFWFEVTAHGKTWIENQGGAGFPLQTDVVRASSTCVDFEQSTARIDIAVRRARRPSSVFVEGIALDADGFKTPATSSSWAATLNTTASHSNAVYEVYSFTPSTLSILQPGLNVGATFGSRNVSDWTALSQFERFQAC